MADAQLSGLAHDDRTKMRFFRPSSHSTKRKNERHLERLSHAIEARRAEFRSNAIAKLTFLNPDMEFAISMTSPKFAGFSRDKELFIFGEFLDWYLPDIEDLRDHISDSDFPERSKDFKNKIIDLTFSSDLPDPGQRRFEERRIRDFLNRVSDRGYTFSERFFPYDLRMLKNDIVIGRSTTKSPKPTGYFSEKTYAHVVEDIGGTGVSNPTIELHLWNGLDLTTQEIAFVYIDPPRRSSTQIRDQHLKLCSQFIPFLKAVEEYLHDSAWQYETAGMGFIKSDREVGLR